jgi:hypothetical protein
MRDFLFDDIVGKAGSIRIENTAVLNCKRSSAAAGGRSVWISKRESPVI